MLIGALRLLVQMLYGHSFSNSVGIAAIFFWIAYTLIWVSSSIVVVFGLLKKAKEAGVTLDYVSRLPAQERKAFEKLHGF